MVEFRGLTTLAEASRGDLSTMYKITLDIENLPEGPYLGTSPDLPGLVVQRNSIQEVLSLAPEQR